MDSSNYIGREACRRLASERDTSVRTAVFIGSTLGLWACFVALVLTQIWGM
jgi:hypothetical protein